MKIQLKVLWANELYVTPKKVDFERIAPCYSVCAHLFTNLKLGSGF
jgi:2-succinyl-5-enolpyruvyl-6-hydroxy-3-cyclohexene-1-carboxylate synthase